MLTRFLEKLFHAKFRIYLFFFFCSSTFFRLFETVSSFTVDYYYKFSNSNVNVLAKSVRSVNGTPKNSTRFWTHWRPYFVMPLLHCCSRTYTWMSCISGSKQLANCSPTVLSSVDRALRPIDEYLRAVAERSDHTKSNSSLYRSHVTQWKYLEYLVR